MLTEFQKIYFILTYNSLYKFAISQFNLPHAFDVRLVTVHTLVFSGHVEHDKNNDIRIPKVNTADSWQHRDHTLHYLEHANDIHCTQCSQLGVHGLHVLTSKGQLLSQQLTTGIRGWGI